MKKSISETAKDRLDAMRKKSPAAKAIEVRKTYENSDEGFTRGTPKSKKGR